VCRNIAQLFVEKGATVRGYTGTERSRIIKEEGRIKYK
jgi:hypothetical protein